MEKPLATTSKDAEELVAIAKSSGLRLMVGFTALFIPSVVRAKQIVQEGLDGHEFGRPYYMYTTRVNLGIVRHDVNVNWDLSPHDVSMFCHFLDSKPLWVSATGCKFVSDQEDALFATIHFENGVNAHMTVRGAHAASSVAIMRRLMWRSARPPRRDHPRVTRRYARRVCHRFPGPSRRRRGRW